MKTGNPQRTGTDLVAQREQNSMLTLGRSDHSKAHELAQDMCESRSKGRDKNSENWLGVCS